MKATSTVVIMMAGKAGNEKKLAGKATKETMPKL